MSGRKEPTLAQSYFSSSGSLAVIERFGCDFSAATVLSKRYQTYRYRTSLVRKFEVPRPISRRRCAAATSGTRPACPCLGRIAARALSRNSNQISCRNGKRRMLIIKPENKNQHFKDPACLRAVAINRKK